MTKILLLLIALPLTTWAGGSISRDEAIQQVCAENQVICSLLKGFELNEIGTAARAGRHQPDGGKRTMPFEFNAKVGTEKVLLTVDRDEDGEIFLNIRSL